MRLVSATISKQTLFTPYFLNKTSVAAGYRYKIRNKTAE
jgi:hypothetical protein